MLPQNQNQERPESSRSAERPHLTGFERPVMGRSWSDWLDGAPDAAGLLCRPYPELMVMERTSDPWVRRRASELLNLEIVPQ